ncbi:Putative Glutaredoxin domain-containing protein [[Torrubiella] hemipterigena]|uniref:Glutaredoxin-like protein n=1 Tax=[Torrubiella] hemipterigena TaxID=1531966 RepID=A0A0A1T612_9HYPO|nr:Putative Glutaredoxin domain-containing protein [[Torrubiella] hemipterigena]
MFATRALLQSCRITMFSRDTCGLCTQAKGVLSDVWDKRPFEFKEVNLSNSEKWRNLYDFDIPVIHFAKANSPEEDVAKAAKAIKLMHRFTPEQVEEKMDLIDKL